MMKEAIRIGIGAFRKAFEKRGHVAIGLTTGCALLAPCGKCGRTMLTDMRSCQCRCGAPIIGWSGVFGPGSAVRDDGAIEAENGNVVWLPRKRA